MMLSPHFSDTELGVQPGSGATPQQIANAQQLCDEVLEPFRTFLGGPVSLSCGFRPPAHNAAAGGVSDSQHLYEGLNSAADMDQLPMAFQVAFDKIRLEGHGLDWDQLILEKDEKTGLDRCVHVSYNGALAEQRREALEGETHGTGGYRHVGVNL